MNKLWVSVLIVILAGTGVYFVVNKTPKPPIENVSVPSGQQGKININIACESALSYMSFPSGEEADKFVAECKAGQHPEVIDQYIKAMGMDGASI